MLKATEEKVVLQYTIISENTNGDLTGEIEVNIQGETGKE